MKTLEYVAMALIGLLSAIIYRLKKTVEEGKREKYALLESLEEGVIAVDKEMTMTYVNFIGAKMLGSPKRHLLKEPFPLLLGRIHPALLEKCKNLLGLCQEKQVTLTDSISLGEGRKIYLDLIASPVKEGAVLIMQDKSSHHRVLEMGRDFVANASHELRTPITIIKGFTETLQEMPELPREMIADITEKIVRNCQRMDTLVKNLLMLADIENLPKTRFQECDLIGLVETCCQVTLSIHKDAEIEINKRCKSVLVSADPDILELALINLLDNAAKYSISPAKITITIDQLADEVLFELSDRGIGIPTADLDHIFERFYTVNKARSRRLGGAGLGLSIVKTIVEKHEGVISASSVLGEGTTFKILLPVIA